MPRLIEITIASEETEELIKEIKQFDGVIGLRIQQKVSIIPPGDLISIEVTNRSLNPLMQFLSSKGIGRKPGGSISTSEPLSIISSSSVSAITNDVSESPWEEMEIVIAKESNLTINSVLLMIAAGIIATLGIATNALHLVIGAMIITPGFVPMTRISLALVAKSQAWRRGLSAMVAGYAALFIAAALTTLVLQWLGKDPLSGEASYLSKGVLVSYWTTITIPSLIVTAVASIVGAVLIATNRSVLTSGVMIALALVPTAAITGMAVMSGQMELAGKSLLRWSIEVSFVIIFSALVFIWKRIRVQKRDMML